MEKENTLYYIPPEAEFYHVAVEAGFAISSDFGIDDMDYEDDWI